MVRSWFVYRLEILEEFQRFDRPSKLIKPYFEHDYAQRDVTDWQRQRGDWSTEWEARDDWQWPGWKWRHESPEPGLDFEGMTLDEVLEELTPSEVDALEVIPPPKIAGTCSTVV
jgi:hypothetical protein